MRKTILSLILATALSAVFHDAAAAQSVTMLNASLVARGSGLVTVSADGIVEISCTGFVLVADGTDVVAPAGWERLMTSDGRWLYVGEAGTVRLAGAAIDAQCGGVNIILYARCEGLVTLAGSGYYRKGFKVGIWEAAGTVVALDG